MATKNSVNNATGDLTVDPGAATDSFVQFAIGASKDFRIGVDDTDDFYKIAEGNALGTNDTFIMTDDGERTMPLNPAFLGNLDNDIVNATGDGVDMTILFDAEIFDQTGDFSIVTGLFTAPRTGLYFFARSTRLDDLTSVNDDYLMSFDTSNRFYIGVGYGSVVTVPEGTGRQHWSMLCDMDVGDTAAARIRASGGGKTVDIIGDATTPQTYFSGYLAA